MCVCVREIRCVMWLRERGGECVREERMHESITNHTEPRTTIHGGDTVVTQLNDSAVTG